MPLIAILLLIWVIGIPGALLAPALLRQCRAATGASAALPCAAAGRTQQRSAGTRRGACSRPSGRRALALHGSGQRAA